MKSLRCLLLVTFVSLLSLSCKDEVTPPIELPEGYQQDIEWPSLADSPWPMNHHDPQSTGRSNLSGALTGEIEWSLDSLELHCGIAVGADSIIYAASNYCLKAVDPDSKVKWKLFFDTETLTTPIIAADGTIYVVYGISLYAVEPTGTVKWAYNAASNIDNDGLNIGMDGTLYFIDNTANLYSVSSNGELKWQTTNSSISRGSHLSFSPDGKTLYICSSTPTIVAFDINNCEVKWTFGEMSGGGLSPLIDNAGNIYFTSIDKNTNNGKLGFFCLYPSGNVRWYVEHNEFTKYSGEPILPNHAEPTMDYLGNIYFGADTLYSVDYNGKLRWKKNLSASPSVSLICDKNNNLYFAQEVTTWDYFSLYKINSNGDIFWSVTSLLGMTSSSSPAIINNMLIVPTQYSYIHLIK